MTSPIKLSRRSFLALGVGAVAWACSPGSENGAGPDESDGGGDNGPVPAAISVVMTAPRNLAPGDTRQAFAILKGQKPTAPEDVEVMLSPPGGEPFKVPVTREEVVLGPGGQEDPDHEHPPGSEVTHIYTFRHDFDRSGVWELVASFDSDGGGKAAAAFQILDDVPSPTVGDAAIASESPTTSNSRGVDPICTRDPACSMHELTIAEALKNNKPTVILFATPQFCTSRTCGPVVDFAQQIQEDAGDDVNFIHVEVWKDDEGAVGQVGGESPTFAEWKFDAEPWIYFVGSDGKVKDRWMGALGSDELSKAVASLSA